MQDLTLEALKAKTTEFRGRLSRGATLDDLLPEAFAVVREVSSRVLRLRHYDVQMVRPHLEIVQHSKKALIGLKRFAVQSCAMSLTACCA